MSMSDAVRDQIHALPWAQLHACGGTDAGIPDVLREICSSANPSAVEEAWSELYDLACHQGATTYEVTPALVRVVAAIATSPESGRSNRVSAVRFLAAVAMAPEFCLPTGETHRAVWRRRSVAPPVDRDISVECRREIGTVASAVLRTLDADSVDERAPYLELAISAHESLAEDAARSVLKLPSASSERLVKAASILTKLLSGGRVDLEWLEDIAESDRSVRAGLTELLEDGSGPDVEELARWVGYRLAELDVCG